MNLSTQEFYFKPSRAPKGRLLHSPGCNPGLMESTRQCALKGRADLVIFECYIECTPLQGAGFCCVFLPRVPPWARKKTPLRGFRKMVIFKPADFDQFRTAADTYASHKPFRSATPAFRKHAAADMFTFPLQIKRPPLVW